MHRLKVRTRRIVLIADLRYAHMRMVLAGVYAYARPFHPWVFRLMSDREAVTRDLRGSAPDGVLAHVNSTDFMQMLQKTGVPTINFSGLLDDTRLPQVSVDNLAVGRMAATHFLNRGFRHFAYVGERGPWLSQRRLAGFRETVLQAGANFIGHLVVGSQPSFTLSSDASAWLAALPKMTAVLVVNDMLGMHICDLLRESGRRIPTDVAVMGVDDDVFHCQMSYPALSSVRLPGQQVGFAAAEMLDQWMLTGQPPRMERTLLPPLMVVDRSSTDIVAVEDPTVAEAVRFINEHADETIQVQHVLEHTLVSRRRLELLFNRHLGRTPLEEIQLCRVERAKRMLSETTLQMPEIARRSGFASADRFAVVFRKHLAITPRDYRRIAQMHWRQEWEDFPTSQAALKPAL